MRALTVGELKEELENWNDNDVLVALVEGAACNVDGLYIYKNEDTGEKQPALIIKAIKYIENINWKYIS